MLGVAARIPDAAARDQFADRIAHKARITEEVVRAEIRRAAVQKQTNIAEVERRAPAMGQIKVAERGLIWALMHAPDAAVAALAGVGDHDFDGLPTREILKQARALLDWPPAGLPAALIERLSTGEAALVGDIAREPRPPADPADCSLTLKRLRLERELGQVRSEIRRLQEADVAAHDAAITELLGRQTDLIRDLEATRAVPDRLKVLD
jgi:hypothetical protein